MKIGAEAEPGVRGDQAVRVGVATAAAIGAVLVGVGLARFAFAPLQPALVADGWFSASAASLLAAANLGGYLIGALSASHVARRISATTVIRAAMLVVAVSFLACADSSRPFIWFVLWRIASGVAGGMIMALAGPVVLAHVPESRRDFIGEMVLYGFTIGIVIAGVFMPVVLQSSVKLGWIVLGVLSLLTTATTWRMWPPTAPPAVVVKQESEHARLFCVQYALVAVGVVPEMVFLADFIARDLGRGVSVGAHFFLLYGVGAVIGPLISTLGSRLIGLRITLEVEIGVQFVAVALLLASSSTVSLAVASFLGGLAMPALIATFLLRSQQITEGDPARHRALWGVATASFALGMSIGAFGITFLIAQFGGGGLAYPLFFGVAAGSLLIALLLEFVIRK